MTSALVVSQPGLDVSAAIDLAREIAESVAALVVVGSTGQASTVTGADSTTAITGDALAVAETLAAAVADVVRSGDHSIVILPASQRFREVAPILAGRLSAACVTDVTGARRADGEVVVERLVYGGVAIASVRLQRPLGVLTAKAAAQAIEAGSPMPATAVVGDDDPRKRLVSSVANEQTGDLSSALRIVSFGRGLRTRDDVALVEELAAVLDAQVGCSRPIVDDLRWLDLSHQVGLTGTTVQPELYLALGISGQIQHLVGMRDSKMIVAVNTDPGAPIFEAADLAVVGDLYEIVPRLAAALRGGAE